VTYQVWFCARQKFNFFRSSDNEAKHLGIGVVEHLPQLIGSDQHTAMFRHSQHLIAHAYATHAFQNKIKLLRANMSVERVRAPGRQTPKSRRRVLAPSALKIIRVGDFHHVGGTPVKVVRRNQKVTFYSLSLWLPSVNRD
jgi:hypothetical protein